MLYDGPTQFQYFVVDANIVMMFFDVCILQFHVPNDGSFVSLLESAILSNNTMRKPAKNYRMTAKTKLVQKNSIEIT